jgi:hypothetical protein
MNQTRYLEIKGGGGAQVFAFGLSWQSLAGGTSEIKEIRSLAKEEKSTRMVRCRVGTNEIIGFVPGKRAPRGKIYSAAAQLAHHLASDGRSSKVNETNALMFYNIGTEVDGEPEVAMIAILGGVPLPGFDAVLPLSKAIDAGRDAVQRIGTRMVETFLCGVFDQSFEQIEEFFPQSSIDNPFEIAPDSKSLIVPVPNDYTPLIMTGVLLALCGGGFAAYTWHEQEQARKAAEARRKADPLIAYVASRDAFLRSNYASPAKATIAGMRTALEMVPTEVGGWTLDTLECGPSSCIAQMNRKFGTNRSFKKGVPEAKMPIYSPDLRMVKYPVEIREGDSDGVMSRPELPSEAQFLEDVGTGFQVFKNAGLEVAIEAKSSAGTWPGGRPPPGNPEVVYAGKWRLKGELQWADVIGMFPKNMTLSRLVVKTTPRQENKEIGATFEAEGFYFVK